MRRNPQAEDPEVDGPFLIDMALVQHPNSGRIFALYDLFPEIKGLWGLAETYEPPFVEIDGAMYQALYTNDRVDKSAPYTIRDGGIVYDPTGSSTDYRIVTQPTKPTYSDYGDILRRNDVVGNIFFITNKTAPFRVAKTAHIHYSYSDDTGKTWSAPHNIAGQLTSSHMNFHGIGPGAGITLTHPRIPAVSLFPLTQRTGSATSKAPNPHGLFIRMTMDTLGIVGKRSMMVVF